MIKNHIKMALRNLFRNKLNSFINIIGLAIGIGASIIMFLYAANELSYNSNFKNADRIYMVYKERHLPTGVQITRDTWYPMANALQEKYSDIDEATHLWSEDDWVQVPGKKFRVSVTYAKQNIFKVFSFPLLKGDSQSFSKDLYSAIISKETVEKLFGDKDPIGKTITVGYKTDYVVRGVFGQIPKNSTYRPEIMIPSNSATWYKNVKDNWGSSWLDTYVMLKKNVNKESFENQLPGFVKNNMGNESVNHLNLRLTALPDLYDETTNANTYAYILFAIALAILIIASINFMNISTAKSLERAKEIGIQKVLGASRKELIKRYLSESVFVSFIALSIGIALAEIFLPYFNKMYDMDLSLHSFGGLETISGLILLGLFTGILSGIYPAFVITKYQPVETLIGKFKKVRNKLNLRSGLIVFQFTLAIIMLIGTTIMLNQIEYMKDSNLNIDKSNLVVISAGASDFPDRKVAEQKIETFKSELRSYSGITGVTSSSMSIPAERGSYTFVYPDDRPKEQRLRERWIAVDEDFFKVYGIKLLDGRNFSRERSTDKDDAVIINEAALKDIGWQNINKGKIHVGGKDRKIIGLVRNYNYQSLESGIEPMIHIYRPSESSFYNYVTVRIAPKNVTGAISFMKEKWKNVDQSRALPFHFVDESFDKLYQTQDHLAVVAETFTGIALIISCLGLFALSALLLAYRTKEIGIRKVLGASVFGITFMLAKDFTKWVVIANVIAIPVTYYLMNKWLQNFTFRIDMPYWIFVASAIVAIMIALITVSIQSVKAATVNPIKSLRYE